VILVGIISAQTIHIIQNFSMSHYVDRKVKLKIVLTKIGPSLLSGSFVVLCSSVFLFGGRVLYFQVFATVIVTTIVVGTFYNFTLLICLLATLSPNHQ